MSPAASELRKAIGDTLVTANGFEYAWHDSLNTYVCTTHDCDARETDAHTDECCARADERKQRVA